MPGGGLSPTLSGVSVRPVQLEIFGTALPMRSFEHAAASRDVAEAIVVRMELSDGAVGWGETLPREYVTGETLTSVVEDIERLYWPPQPDRSGGGLAPADGPSPAARCAVELAWADALARSDGRPLAGAMPPGVRVSGVLGSSDPTGTVRRLRLMRWFGLRDFKLKVGLGEAADAANLRAVGRLIGRAISAGRCTLRVDVNGAWSETETPERAAELKAHGVCAVEQPVFGPPEALIELAQRCGLPLMADESLITAADAEKLARAPGRKVWMNVRLSKNGGMAASRRIALSAADAGVPFVVGCMVGESSILSAAQRALLAGCPRPRFVEGNYGRFLLRDDLTGKSIRFGYRGRLKPLKGAGLGVAVDPKRLERYGRRIKTLHA